MVINMRKNDAEKNLPDVCVICKKERTGKMVFVNHHIDYKADITIRVCRPCHNWLHGRAVYGHPFKSMYDPDISPMAFATSVVEAYLDAMDIKEYNKRVKEKK